MSKKEVVPTFSEMFVGGLFFFVIFAERERIDVPLFVVSQIIFVYDDDVGILPLSTTTPKTTDMPKRKDLKNTINTICSDVFAECVAMSLYHGNADESNVDALLSSIMAIRDDFISRISHPEPGMKKKQYFDHLASSFAEQISEVIDQISNLSE